MMSVTTNDTKERQHTSRTSSTQNTQGITQRGGLEEKCLPLSDSEIGLASRLESTSTASAAAGEKQPDLRTLAGEDHTTPANVPGARLEEAEVGADAVDLPPCPSREVNEARESSTCKDPTVSPSVETTSCGIDGIIFPCSCVCVYPWQQ